MKKLSVRGVYLFLEALKGAGVLEQFLTQCDDENLTLRVSSALYKVGEQQLSSLATTSAVGPKCPACPDPPSF
jgi:hypothetical protein